MPNDNQRLALSILLLEDIAMARNHGGDEADWYLDLRQGEVVMDTPYSDDDETLAALEDDVAGDRFVSIPQRPTSDAWEQMNRFISALEDVDESTRDHLFDAIEGRGAFGRFRDAVFQHGLLQRWYDFKNREDIRDALAFLHSRDLIDEQDIEKGMQLHEERVAQIEQKEEDEANMTAGTQVTCSQTAGYADKLTTGKTYKVLAERKHDLLIRIRDDRGKIIWLPKSHFELVK